MPLYETIIRKQEKTKALNPTPVVGKFTWVANTAMLKCIHGSAPSKLKVSKESTYMKSEGQWLATINDYVPNKNVMPFGNCLKNPHQYLVPRKQSPIGHQWFHQE